MCLKELELSPVSFVEELLYIGTHCQDMPQKNSAIVLLGTTKTKLKTKLYKKIQS